MNVLIVCRDTRADKLAEFFPDHGVYRLEGDSPRPMFGRWLPGRQRWKPVLGDAPDGFNLALVHDGDRVMFEDPQQTGFGIVVHFSGSGFPGSAADNERAFDEWRQHGGRLELHLVVGVSMDPHECAINERDVEMLAELVSAGKGTLPRCCSQRADSRDRIAAFDLLLQGWLMCCSDEEPWPSLRTQFGDRDWLEKVRSELTKSLDIEGLPPSALRVLEGAPDCSRMWQRILIGDWAPQQPDIELIESVRRALREDLRNEVWK